MLMCFLSSMPKKVKASHILVKSEDKANEVLKKLEEGGSFASLAQEYSSCPSKKKGGNLGWFGRGMMVRPFEVAAFDLKKGQVSKPVKTEFGWHIIKVEATE